MGFQQHGHVLFGQTRSDPSLVHDALCCSERQPPTVEEAGFRFEAAARRLEFGDKVRLIPATAARPSPSTTGMSVCAAIASSRSGRITARGMAY